MPTKWLQGRAYGSKNGHGIGFEGPGVDVCLGLARESDCDRRSRVEYLEIWRQLISGLKFRVTHVVKRVEAVVHKDRRVRPQILLLQPLQDLQATQGPSNLNQTSILEDFPGNMGNSRQKTKSKTG